MKEVNSIWAEISKRSTGCFKNEEGTIYYLLNGCYHRLDGPAIEYLHGTKIWYLNGNPHREDGPAKIVYTNSGEYDTDYFWYYGYSPGSNISLFYDPVWRKKIKIKRFL